MTKNIYLKTCADEINPLEVIDKASAQLRKLVEQIEQSPTNMRPPQSADELQSDWQHIMHAYDIEIKQLTKYVGGFSQIVEANLSKLYQAALLNFYQYETALKASSEHDVTPRPDQNEGRAKF